MAESVEMYRYINPFGKNHISHIFDLVTFTFGILPYQVCVYVCWPKECQHRHMHTQSRMVCFVFTRRGSVIQIYFAL